nr:MAG TPA: hypothetical protein [Caudoviricetes sp.]
MKQFFKVVVKYEDRAESTGFSYYIAESMGAVWHYLTERGHAAYIWEIKRLAKIPAGYEAYARDISAI